MTPRPRRPLVRPLTRPLPRAVSLLAALAVPLVLLAACAGGDESSDAGSSSLDAVEAPAPGSADGGGADAEGLAADASVSRTGLESVDQPEVGRRAVISSGTVSLRTDDVAAARFEVQKLVDELRGEITDEETDAGEEVRRSRLVVRVPADAFDEAVRAFEEVGELESSTRSSEDVTTQVIDVEARIRAQEQSLERVEVLFSRATSIRDVVAIEAQLTRRQAALDSLKQQQAYLADQTSLATITVHLERTRTVSKPDDDRAGFLPGLADGWHALGAVGTAVATVTGAVLPFAVLVALLGTPAWLVLRRRPRRGTRPAAAPSSV